MKNRVVSIVITNYDGTHLLRRNFESVVLASKEPDNRVLEIILVDDNSSDRSVEYVREKYPEVRIVVHKVRRGFSAATNTGVRTSRGRYVALLNNDVNVSKKFLVNTLRHFKDKKVFAVGFHEKGYGPATAKFSGGFLDHPSIPETNDTQRSFWASGGSAIFRRKYWNSLGGMDQKLYSPFYWEDIDLSYRAMKRGLIILWEPKALIVHKHGSSTSKVNKLFKQHIDERNNLIFHWKNITSPILIRKHIHGLIKRAKSHPGYFRIILMALKHLPDIWKKRKKEKREEKVSDESIFAMFNS